LFFVESATVDTVDMQKQHVWAWRTESRGQPDDTKKWKKIERERGKALVLGSLPGAVFFLLLHLWLRVWIRKREGFVYGRESFDGCSICSQHRERATFQSISKICLPASRKEKGELA
jgi:hypothetical protein